MDNTTSFIDWKGDIHVSALECTCSIIADGIENLKGFSFMIKESGTL